MRNLSSLVLALLFASATLEAQQVTRPSPAQSAFPGGSEAELVSLTNAWTDAVLLIGLIVGSIASGFAALALTAIRGWGQLSFVRALLQGIIAGLIAGATGLWVAVTLGRSLSVPDRWLIWLAAIPPIVGEFGHFLNRFSIRHIASESTQRKLRSLFGL